MEVFGEIHHKKKKTVEPSQFSFYQNKMNKTKITYPFEKVDEKKIEDWPSHICLYQFGKFKTVQKSVLDLASLLFEYDEKTVLNIKAGFDTCKLEIRPVGQQTFLIKNVQKNIEAFKKISADKMLQENVSETYLSSNETLELAAMFVCNYEAGVPGLQKFSTYIHHLRNIMLQKDMACKDLKKYSETQDCFEKLVFVFAYMMNCWKIENSVISEKNVFENL